MCCMGTSRMQRMQAPLLRSALFTFSMMHFCSGTPDALLDQYEYLCISAGASGGRPMESHVLDGLMPHVLAFPLRQKPAAFRLVMSVLFFNFFFFS